MLSPFFLPVRKKYEKADLGKPPVCDADPSVSDHLMPLPAPKFFSAARGHHAVAIRFGRLSPLARREARLARQSPVVDGAAAEVALEDLGGGRRQRGIDGRYRSGIVWPSVPRH